MADFIIDPKSEDSKRLFYEHLKTFKKPFLCKTQKIEKRSIDWNAYYFGVMIKYVTEETGEDGLKVHDFFGFKYLRLTKNTRRSTASLNNSEFETYALQCRMWALEVLGVKIPLPNEVSF
jgi:hypothetical protein